VIKFFYPVIVVISIAGCSSTSPKVETNIKAVETNAAAGKSEPNAAANQSIAAANNRSNVNREASNDPKIIIHNSAVSKDNIRNVEGKKVGASAAPIAPNITRSVTAAPDNSEITNTMNAKGQPLETRTFKNHRVLVKVERTDLNSRDIKVYLKNGKVVNLPEEMADNFLNAAAADILKAVGAN